MTSNHLLSRRLIIGLALHPRTWQEWGCSKIHRHGYLNLAETSEHGAAIGGNYITQAICLNILFNKTKKISCGEPMMAKDGLLGAGTFHEIGPSW